METESFATVKLEPNEDVDVVNHDGEGDQFGVDNLTPSSSSFVTSIPIGRPEQEAATANESAEASGVCLDDIVTEATRFSNEITRLAGELALSKVRCSEKDAELQECQTKIQTQNDQLQEAEEHIVALQSRLEELEEVQRSQTENEVPQVDLKELKAMVAFERAQKLAVQAKFDKLKSSVEQFNKEFVFVVNQVKQISMERVQGEEEEYEDIILQENQLEGITEFANIKLKKLAETQNEAKLKLNGMVQIVQSLAALVDTGQLEPASPQRRSSMRILQHNVTNSSSPSKPSSPRKGQPDPGPLPPPETVQENVSQQEPPAVPVSSIPGRIRIPRSENHGEDDSKTGPGHHCICGLTYSTRSNLKTHVRNTIQKGKFICKRCNLRFVHLYVFRRHQKDKHGIVLSKGNCGCTDCGKIFATLKLLSRHRRAVHSTAEPEEVQDENISPSPDQVERSAAVIKNTVASVATNSPRHPVVCNKSKRKHDFHPSNPMACLCGKVFNHKYNLRKHVMYYTAARKFTCAQCSKQFLNASQLRNHYRKSHKINSSSNQDVGCRKCGGLFPHMAAFHKHRKDCSGDPDSASLQGHDENGAQSEEDVIRRVNYSGRRHGMNIALRHQGFFCICGKKFITRKRLDGHVAFDNREQSSFADVEETPPEMLEIQDDPSDSENVDEENIHVLQDVIHGKHPFKVNQCLCGQKAGSKKSLLKHINYFTTEKIFKCDHCEAGYEKISYLRQHLQRVHKEVGLDKIIKMKFGCKLCGKIFPILTAFQRHAATAHGQPGLKPSTVQKLNRVGLTARPSPVPMTVQKMAPSSRSVAGRRKRFSCKYCKTVSFLALYQLHRHLRITHKENSPFVIGCRDCGIGFKSRKEHSQHRIFIHGSAIGKPKLKQIEESKNGENGEYAAFEDNEECPIPIPITLDDTEDYEMEEEPLVPKSEVPEVVPDVTSQMPGPSKRLLDVVHKEDPLNSGVKKFACSCGLYFKHRCNLISHINTKTSKGRFSCSLCGEEFFYFSILKRHMQRKHKKAYMNGSRGCSICGQKFETWEQLHRHRSEAHARKRISATSPETPETVKASTSRTEVEVSKNTLELHDHGVDVSKASKGNFCLCGKNCNSEQSLNAHLQECGSQPTSEAQLNGNLAKPGKSVLRKGLMTKRNLMALWCRPCGKYFKTKSQRLIHEKTFHKEKFLNIMKARQRRQRASTNSSGEHFDASVDENILTCSCGREYQNRSGLGKHIRLKNRGKLFRCKWCIKVFDEYANLKKHAEKVHNVQIKDEAPIVCGVCSKICYSLSELSKHRKIAH